MAGVNKIHKLNNCHICTMFLILSELTHLGLLLATFPAGAVILGMMDYDRLVDISVAFAVIIMFSGIFAQSFLESFKERGLLLKFLN